MATRSRGLSAGFGWLNRGVGVGFRHPKPIFGGAFLLCVAVMIPSLISFPTQVYLLRTGSPLQPVAGIIAGFSLLVSLLVLPLYAGYLQVVDNAEQGRVARAWDIVNLYRQGKAMRLIGYGVLMLVLYVAVFGLVIVSTSSGFFHWYAEALNAQANHLPPPTALPDGFWKTILLAMLVGVFFLGFYSIGLGQITLGNRSVFGAIGDGITGAAKNVLPLLMLALGLLLAWIGIAVCFGIVAAVLAIATKFVGVWLLPVVLFPLYVALILLVFSAMFGVMYYLWRDVCGDDGVAGVGQALVA